MSSYFTGLTYRAAVFPLTYASSIFLDNSFRKHSAIFFQYIYIFSNLNMVIRSSNSCFSLFIYRGTPPCDHPVYTTTSCLSSPPIVFHPDVKISVSFYFENLFNATTSVSRPGFYGPTLVASTGFHCIEIINNNNNNN